MIKQVPINELNDYWAEVRNGLNDLLAKAPDRWKPEDVYVELLNGGSLLYIAEDEDGLIGFTILTPFRQYGDLVINVWVAYNKRDHEKFMFALDDVKMIAEQAGAKYIIFSSVRSGASKLAALSGFVPAHKNYIYEV